MEAMSKFTGLLPQDYLNVFSGEVIGYADVLELINVVFWFGCTATEVSLKLF